MKPSALPEISASAATRVHNARTVPKHIALVPEAAWRCPDEAAAWQFVTALREALALCTESGAACLTVQVWRKGQGSAPEVLTGVLARYLREELAAEGQTVAVARLAPEGARLGALSALEPLRPSLGERLRLTLAFEYDGRLDLAHAAGACIAECLAHGREAASIDQGALEQHLLSAALPPVDFLVHTATRGTLSDFLLWQSAYAELLFLEAPFVSLRRAHLETALEDYARRRRTFGALPQ